MLTEFNYELLGRLIDANQSVKKKEKEASNYL
jgi:hypothetical protein